MEWSEFYRQKNEKRKSWVHHGSAVVLVLLFYLYHLVRPFITNYKYRKHKKQKNNLATMWAFFVIIILFPSFDFYYSSTLRHFPWMNHLLCRSFSFCSSLVVLRHPSFDWWTFFSFCVRFISVPGSRISWSHVHILVKDILDSIVW